MYANINMYILPPQLIFNAFKKNYTPFRITCTNSTTANEIQQNIEANMLATAAELVPATGEKLVVLLDNIMRPNPGTDY